jgi:type II secretory pathway component PulJ
MATGKARAAGFTLPLTMALAFSLMAMASAIVGMVLVSDKQAKAAASEAVTRASLESAVEAGLFDLEQNGEPQALEWDGPQQTLNGQTVTLVVADARYKPDINSSKPDAVGAVLAEPALKDRTLAALAPPSPDAPRAPYTRFIEFAQATAASPAEEDCLRRRLTIGRTDAMAPAPPQATFAPPRQPLAVGAVIDVRAEMRDWEGRLDVLWRRARYTGQPARPWLTHDWRLVRLGRAEPDCPLVDAAPTISNELHDLP